MTPTEYQRHSYGVQKAVKFPGPKGYDLWEKQLMQLGGSLSFFLKKEQMNLTEF